MKYSQVQDVLIIIEEFRARSRKLHNELKKNQPQTLQEDYWIDRCKEAAALKRTSMDLTRALTIMRREK